MGSYVVSIVANSPAHVLAAVVAVAVAVTSVARFVSSVLSRVV